MLYPSTGVGLGYGLSAGAVSRKAWGRPPNPLRADHRRSSSRPAGWGILTPFPSATAVALALGARLTLRGSTLRRNPWTFGVRGSHPQLRYSCQHSHFRYLHGRSHARFIGLRNAPLPRQGSGTRGQGSGRTRPPGMQTTQHPADLTIAVAPSLTHARLETTEIDAIAQPQLRLVTAADRGQ
jgi:hypothetical protein